MVYGFVDIETTGLDPDAHDVLEVGIVLEVPETSLTEVDFALPVDLAAADPGALKVNRAIERAAELEAKQLKPAAGASEVATQLADAVFIGNNPAFDQAFLRRLLIDNGFTPTWKYHVVDVKALAGMALGLTPPWSTTQLLTPLGLSDNVEHVALADAYKAREIFWAAYNHRSLGVTLP